MGAILEIWAPAALAARRHRPAMTHRTVFFVSDGTGITAETFGNAILAQFEITPRHVRLPFTDTPDKAHQVVRQINHTAELEGKKPLVFTTLVDRQALQIKPDYGAAHHNLAIALYSIGDFAGAWREIGLCRECGVQPNPAFIEQLRQAMPEPNE